MLNHSPSATYVPARPRRSKWHGWLLACFYVLAVLWGVRSAYASQPSMSALLLPLAMSMVMCNWAVSDAIARGHPIPLLARAWFLIAASIVVPGYILWSRGWRGMAKLALHSVLWYVLCLAAMFVARGVLYGWA